MTLRVYVDDCPHTFEHLATEVLPAYLTQLRDRLEFPHPTARFAAPGQGARTLARELGLTGDFSGCYVLLDGARPFYVGISRGVLARLRQHFTGRTHFNASLAYAMARREYPGTGQRSRLMAKPEFRDAFDEAQKKLHSSSVAFVEIENPLELYLFEAYAAMTLGTSEWNTFRTH